jgi:lysozyme
MAKKPNTDKLFLRLFLVLLSVGFSFMIALKIQRFLRPGSSIAIHEKHRTFDIVLPSNYAILGIDVSRHQDEINWNKVDSMRSGGKEISFVFIKATEGISRQDPKFAKNWKGIKHTKLIRGAYHFYYPSRDATKQARNFTSQVSLLKGDLPPVADIEHSNGKSRKKICEGLATFLNDLEKKYKVKPIIYTNLSFYNKYLAGEFDSYPLWISCYYDEERFLCSCNHKWTFWQHSERGHIDGINGFVDFNVYKGSLAELSKFCIQ